MESGARLNGNRPLGLASTLLVANILFFFRNSSFFVASGDIRPPPYHFLSQTLPASLPRFVSSPWPPPTSSLHPPPPRPPPPLSALLSASALHRIHHISASTVLVLPFSLPNLRNSTAKRSLTDPLVHVGSIRREAAVPGGTRG